MFLHDSCTCCYVECQRCTMFNLLYCSFQSGPLWNVYIFKAGQQRGLSWMDGEGSVSPVNTNHKAFWMAQLLRIHLVSLRASVGRRGYESMKWLLPSPKQQPLSFREPPFQGVSPMPSLLPVQREVSRMLVNTMFPRSWRSQFTSLQQFYILEWSDVIGYFDKRLRT